MKLLSSLNAWLLRVTLFGLPLFFLPTTSEFFDFNKLALLVIGLLATTVFWAARQMTSGNLRIYTTPLDLPIFAFAAATVASALIQTPNEMNAFFFPGTATLVLAGTLLYFHVIQQAKESENNLKALLASLLLGAGLSGFVSLAASLGGLTFLSRFFPLPAFVQAQIFTTSGGLLPAIALFLLSLPVALMLVRGSEGARKIALLFASLGIVVGLLATLYWSVPGKPSSPRVMPLSSGWAVALETAKREPILGVGPGNFLAAFNVFKSVQYNLSDVWNFRFTSSSNWFLHVFTTTGLIGLAALVWILYRLWKANLLGRDKVFNIKDNQNLPKLSLLLSLALLLVIPGNTILLILFYLFLAASAFTIARDLQLEVAAFSASLGSRQQSRVLPGILLLAALAFFGVTLFYGGRVYAAEITYKRALDALGRNDGTATYNLLINAINQNPQVDRYRITYSQVNLALANSIAGKEELSDQDRQTIAQLVQQSIREAKAAVALNPQISSNWENLARLYQALIPFANDADSWTIAAYQQAVALDPNNPNLRIAFGGVFYSLKRYDEAIRLFETAAAFKPDHANAYYNLAVALRDRGDEEAAVRQMQQVLQLVEPGSADAELAQEELDVLLGKLAEKQATASGTPETLNVAETPTEPVIEPPLDLPEESAPPQTEAPNTTPAQPGE